MKQIDWILICLVTIAILLYVRWFIKTLASDHWTNRVGTGILALLMAAIFWGQCYVTGLILRLSWGDAFAVLIALVVFVYVASADPFFWSKRPKKFYPPAA